MEHRGGMSNGPADEPASDDGSATRRRLAALLAHTTLTTHQLNNPLATLAMAGSLLGPLDDAEERQRFGAMLEREALRAGRLAEELREMAALPPSSASPVELRSLVDEAIDRAGGEGAIEVVGDRWPVVTTDAVRLRLALVTLLRQLLRAQPAGSGVTVSQGRPVDAGAALVIEASGVAWSDRLAAALDGTSADPGEEDSTAEALLVAQVLLDDQGGAIVGGALAGGGTRLIVQATAAQRPL